MMAGVGEWDVKSCGVECHGLALGVLTQEQVDFVKRQFTEHGVCYFRDVASRGNGEFSCDEHLAFSELFGPVNVNRYFSSVEGHPRIAKVEKKEKQVRAIGEAFHSDHTYDLAPALGSVLVSRHVPPKGGDTIFVDMRKAYDTLPQALKEELEGMRAVHFSGHVFARPRKDPGTGEFQYNNKAEALMTAEQPCTTHPVVIRHPVSGRKTLFVNPGFTIHFEGQTPRESKPLLMRLYKHAVRAEHMFRFKWAGDSAVLWDNRAVWHCAMNDYAGKHRLMHRITIDGEPLNAANPDRAGHSVPTPRNEFYDPDATLPWPQTVLDQPFVQLIRATLETGIDNLNADGQGEKISPWWPTPTPLQSMALRAMSIVGLPAKL